VARIFYAPALAPGKPTLIPHLQPEAGKRLEAGKTQRSVASSYNVSQSTISRLMPI
jgi:hypothetical protein